MREPGDAASHDKADASGRWAGERLAASGADTVTLCGHLRALELTLNATALQNVLVGMLRGMADGARQALQRAMLSLTAVPAPATQAIGWPELFEVAAESYWVAQPRRLGSADLAIDALTEDDLDACFEGLVEYVAANTTSGHGLSQICAALRRAAVYQLRLRLDAALAAREAALRAQVVAALGDRFPNRETLDAALTAAGMDDPKERGPILDRCADERLPRVFREALKAVTTQPGPHWTPEGQALTVAAACVGLGLDAYANQPSVVARAFADALSAVAHTASPRAICGLMYALGELRENVNGKVPRLLGGLHGDETLPEKVRTTAATQKSLFNRENIEKGRNKRAERRVQNAAASLRRAVATPQG